MKLYEVNQAIEDIFERMVDPETGEIIGDDALMEELGALQMERSRILEYLAKLVLNNKASIESIKDHKIEKAIVSLKTAEEQEETEDTEKE